MGSGDVASAAVRRRRTHTTRAGRTLELSALTLQDIISLREQAFSEFKRQRISTWTDNADLLPEDQRVSLVRVAFERAENLTWLDLPRQVFEGEAIDYGIWWMGATPPGQLHAIWLSLRASPSHHGLSLEGASLLLSEHPEELSEISDIVAELSAPALLGEANPPRRSRRGGRRARQTGQQ